MERTFETKLQICQMPSLKKSDTCYILKMFILGKTSEGAYAKHAYAHWTNEIQMWILPERFCGEG